MTLINTQIKGNSVMEQNVLAVAAVYETLTIASRVIKENGKPPTWMFGRKMLETNLPVPPSVVWVPQSGPIQAPVSAGGAVVGTERQKPIADRLLSFDVHCNGVDFEQTENLLASVIAATREAANTGAEFGDETWLTEQEGVSDWSQNNTVAILQVSLRMPVIDEEAGLVVITDQTHTEDLDC